MQFILVFLSVILKCNMFFFFFSVIKGCKLESQVEEAVKTSNQKELMALEEQLGDLCCKMNSYNEAIQHYKRQVSNSSDSNGFGYH